MGIATIVYSWFVGLGIFAINNPVGWGFFIVNFVFWVGIGHAGTLISAILFLFRQKWRTSINRAAEAMTMAKRAQKRSHTGNTFFVSEKCHPQTIDVVRTRAEPLGYTVVVGDHATYDFGDDTFGALVQTPDTEGTIHDFSG